MDNLEVIRTTVRTRLNDASFSRVPPSLPAFDHLAESSFCRVSPFSFFVDHLAESSFSRVPAARFENGQLFYRVEFFLPAPSGQSFCPVELFIWPAPASKCKKPLTE